MEKNIKFEVSVIGCNIEVFMINFAPYIIRWRSSWFNDRIFSLVAPESVYNQIQDLSEENIFIMD